MTTTPGPLPLGPQFWSKVDEVGECWVWTAGTRRGYGLYNMDHRKWYAHRLAYAEVKGPIPEGLQLDHLCRNILCVNPDHLEAVTLQENVRRGNAGWNGLKTICRNGHPYDEANTYVRPSGKRQCRVCCRDQARGRYVRETA